MTDMELAEEIEQVILAGNKVGIPLASIIKMGFTSQQWNEIIAALRRERPPSDEMMMMGLRVVVNPSVPADEVWITNAHGKRLGTIVNLSAAEAEGRKS